jgi:NO-binding membrane sensor protein with MHYT domain
MGWHILTALAAGVAIWCTHFVAMLGYHVGVPVGFDPVLTIVSLAFAVFGATAGFAVAQRRYLGRFTSAIGGAIVGLAIAAMHYTGMIAYRVQGRVSWDKYYLVASIVLAVALSAAALHCAAFTPPRPRSHGGPARVRHRLPSLHRHDRLPREGHGDRRLFLNPEALQALRLRRRRHGARHRDRRAGELYHRR